MEYHLVKIPNFSNSNITVYTLLNIKTGLTLFDDFINDHRGNYTDELKSIVKRINSFKIVGARYDYFKHNEGTLSDGVCALYDSPNSKLRLYCIRYGTSMIILGGGGFKSKETRALQETPKLLIENKVIRELSKEIEMRRRNNDLIISKDFLSIEGDIIFNLEQ